MKIVNLLGYNVSYYNYNGEETVFPAGKGLPQKLTGTLTVVDTAEGINVIKFVYPSAEAIGIPKQTKDTFYIVSQQICQAYPDRKDLVYPSNFVKDEAGKIVGCKMLVVPA